MDATATTFTKRQNAKRAAEAMIAKGAAPALDYGIKQIDNPGHSDDGRFEIVWKTGNDETAVTEADVAAAEENWSEPATSGEESEIAGEEFPCEQCDRREACQDAGLCLQGQSYAAPATNEAERIICRVVDERVADQLGTEYLLQPVDCTSGGMWVPVGEIEARDLEPESRAKLFGEEGDPQPATAATGPLTGDAAPEPAPGAEAAPERAPAPAVREKAEPQFFPVGAYVHVQLGRLRIRAGHITQRIDQANVRVHLLGAAEGVTQLVNVAQLYHVEEKPMPAEEPKPARQRRRGQATVAPAGTRSRYSIDADLLAAGRLPDKAPEVTSAANQRYQTHFDKLLELATAGDWAAVRKYEITGSNSYSKMVARYREDLLAVRKAQQTEAAAKPESDQAATPAGSAPDAG
jgi:hypothetical protein